MPEWIETLTVDASYDDRTGATGVGIVIQRRSSGQQRRRRGPILEEIAEGHLGLPRAHGELFAVFRALEVAIARGFTRIKVRSDYNGMRRKLREQHRSQLAGVGLQGRVLALARTLDWIDFGYVARRKNHLAHNLARQGRFLVPRPIGLADQYVDSSEARHESCDEIPI